MRLTGLVVSMFALAACGTVGQKFDGWAGVKPGDRITVLPLSDHPSNDPADSKDTGIICHGLIVTAMKKRLVGVDVDPFVPPAYDPRRGYSRDEALVLGKGRTSNYVLYGRCHEFYNVAPFTFRADLGGIDVEVVSVSDGKLVYRAIQARQVSNLSTPQSAIDDIADDVAKELPAK